MPHDSPHIQINSPSLTPVLRLSTELLCCIFRMLFDTQVSAWHNYFYLPMEHRIRPSRAPWTVILQVCRDWRSAALGYAVLWKHIYTSSPGWTSHFLQFSTQLPLDIDLQKFKTTTNMQMASLIGPHSGRVRSLSVTEEVDHMNDFVNHILGQGAPQLTDLKLVAREPHTDDGPNSRPMLVLGDALFSGRISGLDALEVNCQAGNLLVQMDCPAFRTLTSLKIISDHAWQRSTTTHFLWCLQTWTCLRRLYLDFGLPGDITQIPPVKFSNRIALPSIQTLEIEDDAANITDFLARVSLRPSIHLDFKCLMADENASEDENNFKRAAIVNVISQVSDIIDVPLVELDFMTEGSGSEGSIELSADTVTGTLGERHNSQIVLTLISLGDSELHADCFQVVLDALQLSHVRRLLLYCAQEYFCIDWIRVLQRLQSLRELLIFSFEFEPLIEALGTAASERQNDLTGKTDYELYAPDLQYLQVVLYCVTPSVINALGTSLKNRMEWGSRLPRLCTSVFDEPLDGAEAKLFEEVACIYENKFMLDGNQETEDEGDTEGEGHTESDEEDASTQEQGDAPESKDAQGEIGQ